MAFRPDPIGYPPRGLSRDAAARYLGLSTKLFDELVEQGSLPKAKLIQKRRIWDRFGLDQAFAEFPDEANENALDRLIALGGKIY